MGGLIRYDSAMLDSEFQHNFHTHTFRCKHAKGDVDDYCRWAVAHGMKTLGMSDHTALPDDRWIRARMAMHELDDYVRAVRTAKTDYPDLRVLLGMECEYVPKFHSFFEDLLLGEYDFEYLIAGAHFFLDGEGEWKGTYGGTTSYETLMQYSSYVCDMIDSGLFDFIAHPDLFGNCYVEWDANTIACSRDIIVAAAEKNVGLEINALGCRKIAKKKPDNPYPLYPWPPFWELASEYDVTVIVNADAHRPEDLQGLTSQAEALRLEYGLTAMQPESIGNRAVDLN